ncbi:oxidoreductase [Paenibacillus physcomitrellae]|uniref:Scyllo-inositol 2-dehydrogenase (NADP(+)) n=1 Tax=Paenibacillus physcomitrellae TaxID=1619311 RepID=A0ABQ1GTG9_9BACL|nr:oxidoreductase [Paenibacillus physcomitrellae]GGA49778.1 scyllo-inositol 2-dehydrogenase (NADP(+)) [Paenibacillus physcomitrellae]
METIKVGLVGYGLSGATFHAPLMGVLEEFEIAKVVSSNTDKVQQDLKNAEVVSSLEQVLADPAIDLVVITTPTHLHFEMAKQSLMAGKHVILEKPMVVEAREATELIRIAEEQGLLLSVYHNRRWDNDFLTVKKLVNEGALGEINTYQVHFDRFRPHVRDRWREQPFPGSGTLYDLGSHLIDQALNLFGWPESISADVFGQRENAQTDDYFHLVLGYSKLRVILHAGSIVAGNGPRFQVHGSKGSFIKYGIDGQENLLKEGHKPADSSFGADQPEFYGKLITVDGETEKQDTIETLPGSYLTYYKQIAASLLQGAKPPVTAQEGLAVIAIIEAALASSKEKKTIVLDRYKEF